MKSIIKTILCSLSLLFVSCDLIPIGGVAQKIDLGYPKTVTFPCEGGEMVLNGDYFNNVDIVSNKDFQIEYWGYNEADSTEYYVSDWLKVEYKASYLSPIINEMKIIVEPNTTGKSRKLYLHVNSFPDYQEITVKQERK